MITGTTQSPRASSRPFERRGSSTQPTLRAGAAEHSLVTVWSLPSLSDVSNRAYGAGPVGLQRSGRSPSTSSSSSSASRRRFAAAPQSGTRWARRGLRCSFRRASTGQRCFCRHARDRRRSNLSSQDDHPQPTLGAVVVERAPRVGQEELEARSLVDRVSEGFAEWTPGQGARAQCGRPLREAVDDRLASLRPHLETFGGAHDLDGGRFMLDTEEWTELADTDIGVIARASAGLKKLLTQVAPAASARSSFRRQ